MNRVVRSTSVLIAELPSLMISGLPNGPSTARSFGSAGRSLIRISARTNTLPCPGMRPAQDVREIHVRNPRNWRRGCGSPGISPQFALGNGCVSRAPLASRREGAMQNSRLGQNIFPTSVKAQNERDIIETACRAAIQRFRNDCSGFLKAVAQAIGRLPLALQGDANAIVHFLDRESVYESLGGGLSAARRAGLAADQGRFVIAGSTNSTGHGHVAVIVKSGSPWPLAYWGSISRRSRMKNPRSATPLTQSWRSSSLESGKVEFFVLRKPVGTFNRDT